VLKKLIGNDYSSIILPAHLSMASLVGRSVQGSAIPAKGAFLITK